MTPFPALLAWIVAAVALLPGSLGCSAKLSNPVLVLRTAPFVIVRQHLARGRNAQGSSIVCEQKDLLEFKTLPAGEAYGLNVDTGWFGWFAKNELSVEFHDSGQLKSVTLNSDPQADEVIQSSANLVKEVGAAVTAAAGAAAAPPGACVSGSVTTEDTVKCLVTLQCFKALGACPTSANPCPAA